MGGKTVQLPGLQWNFRSGSIHPSLSVLLAGWSSISWWVLCTIPHCNVDCELIDIANWIIREYTVTNTVSLDQASDVVPAELISNIVDNIWINKKMTLNKIAFMSLKWENIKYVLQNLHKYKNSSHLGRFRTLHENEFVWIKIVKTNKTGLLDVIKLITKTIIN